MRKLFRWEKDQVSVQNIYGKTPRRLGNRTLASLQINVSNRLAKKYTDSKGNVFPDRYGAIDVIPIVRGLDKEFSDEIKNSNRQPGMYAVKDDIRLEYRSLPNSVFLLTEFPERLYKVFKDLDGFNE